MGKALSPEATQVERAAAYEAAYNNRARVPGHPAILDRWRKDSLRAIDARRPETIEYGPSERQKMEWFDAGPGAPVAVFMHGGYWQALEMIVAELAPTAAAVFDCQVAAVCVERGVDAIWTADRGFPALPGMAVTLIEPGGLT